MSQEMADDWDLNAVVRSCKSATQTATNTNIATTITPTNPVTTSTSEEEDPFWDWLLKSEEVTGGDRLFSFTSDLHEPRANAFQELQQFYEPFFLNPTTINNPSTNNSGTIIPNSPIISDFGGSTSSGQHHLQQQQQHAQQQHHFLPTNTRPITGMYPPGFGGLQQQPQLLPKPENQIKPQTLDNNQQGFMRRVAHPMVPALPLPCLRPMPYPLPRSKKRKSQQKKQVCEVSAENLTSDLWAWRKYGQKPIKGSPHPRNYYRCSSSKGCAARKQVERSPTDPNIFIVTYTGDHTHPRPTHRNSLAGSTRNKLLATTSQTQPINKDSGSPTVPDTSSPLSAASLSRTAQADQDAVANKVSSDNSPDQENEELDDEEERDDNENESEDDMLIANRGMSEEISLGMKQLVCTSSSGSGGSLAGASADNLSAGATIGGGFYIR